MGTGVYGESQPTRDVNEWEYGTQFDHVVKNAGLDTTVRVEPPVFLPLVLHR
jgi:hypothetical protein